MTTPLPGGPLTHGHIPLPIGTVAHRPIERRNTSPFGPPKRVADLTPAQHARRQKEAAETLRRLDRRRAGRPEQPSTKSKGKAKASGGGNPDGRPYVWDVQEAERRYAAGQTAATIGADLGVSAKTVMAALKRRGNVTMRRASDYANGAQTTLFDHAEMLADAPNMTLRRLAEKYAVDPRTIRRHLKRAAVRCLDGRKVREAS